MASSSTASDVSGETYYKTINTFQSHVPVSPVTVGQEYMSEPTEWYHLLGNIEDFIFLLSYPRIRAYSICRCHVIDEDGNTDHEHFHALVHITCQSKLQTIKRNWRRQTGSPLHKKTTFKRIHCLDHAVGVLRYICCQDGQKWGKRDADGLRTHPHTHYNRVVFDKEWLHPRGRRCPKIRETISRMCASGIDWRGANFESDESLHVFNTCKCETGRIGRELKRKANDKRRAFYETQKGMAVKRNFRKKAELKKKFIELLNKMDATNNTKARLYKKTLAVLIDEYSKLA